MSDGYGIVWRSVMQSKSLSCTAKAIYAYLASYADKNGTCFPSVERILDELNINKTTFYKHIRQLELAGIVQKISRNDHGKFVVTHYCLPRPKNSDTVLSTSEKSGHGEPFPKLPYTKNSDTDSPKLPYTKISETNNTSLQQEQGNIPRIKDEQKNNNTYLSATKSETEIHVQRICAILNNARGKRYCRPENGHILSDLVSRTCTWAQLEDLARAYVKQAYKESISLWGFSSFVDGQLQEE